MWRPNASTSYQTFQSSSRHIYLEVSPIMIVLVGVPRICIHECYKILYYRMTNICNDYITKCMVQVPTPRIIPFKIQEVQGVKIMEARVKGKTMLQNNLTLNT